MACPNPAAGPNTTRSVANTHLRNVAIVDIQLNWATVNHFVSHPGILVMPVAIGTTRSQLAGVSLLVEAERRIAIRHQQERVSRHSISPSCHSNIEVE